MTYQLGTLDSNAYEITKSFEGEQAVRDCLEALVDTLDLNVVLDKLAEVADAKAEHLRSNWQDEQTGKAWERAAAKLTSMSFHDTFTDVSPRGIIAS